ncbi:MAG TPA: phospholipase D-like domain-containing protein [Acidimicrobiales bacterium]
MAIALRVHQNGDDVFLTWRSAQPIAGCLGFAVLRERNGAAAAPLPSYAGFENQTWKAGDHKASTVWPIQKYWWTDYTASCGDRVRYRIVPMIDDGAGGLEQDLGEASRWSTEVTLAHEVSPGFSCYFNRGIVASQFVQRLLDERLTVGQRRSKLDTVVTDLAHPEARDVLAGELRLGLRALLAKARDEHLSVTAALFELTDPELVNDLVGLGNRLEIVLADGAPVDSLPATLPAGETDPAKGTKTDENASTRQLLGRSGAVVHDRMSNRAKHMPDKTVASFLAHNKILVVSDAAGVARWTWTGSTNWTPSGLCTQANNGILIDDPKVAARFSRQIRALAAAGDDSPAALAQANSAPSPSTVAGATSGTTTVHSAKATTWFTRTVGQVDLDDAAQRIADATEGALFLMFQVGLTNSLLASILGRRSDPGFFVHGVISSQPKDPSGPAGPADPMSKQIGFVHKNQRVRYAPDILLPFALGPNERWLEEFVKKNGAHAIIHSKVVVLDPFGARPVVMTGSHNMGSTASKANDENLLIVSGNRALAAAYTTNIMAIYDNFRWRFRVAEGSKWRGSSTRPEWQDRYFAGEVPEFAFFRDEQ